MKLVLFDLDGVLLHPLGYRKAVADTFQWVITQADIKTPALPNDIPALFESIGITSEWDMLALSISILLETYCQKNDIQLQALTLQNGLQELALLNNPEIRPDYHGKILQFANIVGLEDIPSYAVYQHGREFTFPYLFNHILLKDILWNTRSIKNSLITKVFQNLVLGDELFLSNYQEPALINGISYLKQYDQALIEMEWVSWIKKTQETGENQFAALTARPSLGPNSYSDADTTAYSPEAELALSVIDLSKMTLLGYGKLQYEASKWQVSADSLLKPAAYHTIAALFTSLSHDEIDGLVKASAFIKGIESGTPEIINALIAELPEKLELAIFEDSPGGIKSVVSAAEILKKAGLSVHVYCFGVTKNQEKKRSLLNLGAEVYPTINDALRAYRTTI